MYQEDHQKNRQNNKSITLVRNYVSVSSKRPTPMSPIYAGAKDL
jgi:hypothetical protein